MYRLNNFLAVSIGLLLAVVSKNVLYQLEQVCPSTEYSHWNVRWPRRVLLHGAWRWVCAARPINVGKRWDIQTDGRQTDALRLPMDAASIITRASVIGQQKRKKGFPYSLPSVGLGADPGVQAVSPQIPPLGGRLPSLFARPAVTFPAAEHHRP